jgi:hypothetical protein
LVEGFAVAEGFAVEEAAVDVACALGALANAALMRDEEKLRYDWRDELVSSSRAPLLAGAAAILSRNPCCGVL